MKVARTHSHQRTLRLEIELCQMENVTDLLSKSNHVFFTTELKTPVMCRDKMVKVAAQRSLDGKAGSGRG